MDNILEELWYGNVAPWEQSNRLDREYKELTELLCRNRDRLTEGLTEAQKELLDKYDECQNELNAKTERNAFVQGFCLGTRLLAAATYTQTGE
ncbi:MAG: hypothetical protein J6M42_12600 [Clostridia bacterium]|nr:hypothetical protein [Clostridia bacterium]